MISGPLWVHHQLQAIIICHQYQKEESFCRGSQGEKIEELWLQVRLHCYRTFSLKPGHCGLWSIAPFLHISVLTFLCNRQLLSVVPILFNQPRLFGICLRLLLTVRRPCSFHKGPHSSGYPTQLAHPAIGWKSGSSLSTQTGD